jgi:predicted nucleic acid-binding protein
MILVDTSVWSLALRRKSSNLSAQEWHLVSALRELIHQHRVRLLGSTRQEVLSGIREHSQVLRIRDHMRDFPNVVLDESDYERAAQASHQCRAASVSSSPVDMLMCAVALRHDWEIFTTDRDFAHYRDVLKIRLLSATLG